MSRFAFTLRDRGLDEISIAAIRRRALRRLPRMLGAYIESTADDGHTAERNLRAFGDYRLLPQALAGVTAPDLSVSLGEERLALPVMIAPTGLAGLVRPGGELDLARAAESAGTRLILSTASSTHFAEVSAATPAPHWFQLYPIGDQEAVRTLVNQVRGAGFSTLVVTVDTAVAGKREAERRHGLGLPVKLTPGRLCELMLHPRWLANHFLRGGKFPVLYPPSPDAIPARPGARYLQSDMTWSDVAWLRSLWSGPFLVKGLLRPEDARIAVHDIGADGVILSNHGGRQLGCTVSPLDTVGAVARLLNGRGWILLDGGIRRGSDVVKALCLGAHAVLIGRPALYGLASSGEAGVARVLQILADEIRDTMVLLGCPRVGDLSGKYLMPAVTSGGLGRDPD